MLWVNYRRNLKLKEPKLLKFMFTNIIIALNYAVALAALRLDPKNREKAKAVQQTFLELKKDLPDKREEEVRNLALGTVRDFLFEYRKKYNQ